MKVVILAHAPTPHLGPRPQRVAGPSCSIDPRARAIGAGRSVRVAVGGAGHLSPVAADPATMSQISHDRNAGSAIAFDTLRPGASAMTSVRSAPTDGDRHRRTDDADLALGQRGRRWMDRGRAVELEAPRPDRHGAPRAERSRWFASCRLTRPRRSLCRRRGCRCAPRPAPRWQRRTRSAKLSLRLPYDQR